MARRQSCIGGGVVMANYFFGVRIICFNDECYPREKGGFREPPWSLTPCFLGALCSWEVGLFWFCWCQQTRHVCFYWLLKFIYVESIGMIFNCN